MNLRLRHQQISRSALSALGQLSIQRSVLSALGLPSTLRSLLYALCLPFISGLLGVLSSCETPEGGKIDFGGLAPSTSGAFLQPDSINVDTLTAVGGLYTIRATATIRASDPDNGLDRVTASLLQRNSTGTLSEISLLDNGVSPDAVAGDGIYSGLFDFTITRAETGPYRVLFLAVDNENLESSTSDLTLATIRRNSAPSLDPASLDAPSLVTIPGTGSVQITMSIAAADSDGLADIREVYFLSIDGDFPDFRFPLKDDGGAGQGPPSGDRAAGDGTFTILLNILDSPTIRGVYRLLFKAQDTIGDTSETVLHTLTIE